MEITQNEKNQKTEEFKMRIFMFNMNLIELMTAVRNTLYNMEIKKQLIRSGTSVGANLFEARGANSKKDFIRFFEYSLKSANETKFWLCLLAETKLIEKENTEKCKYLIKEIKEISNIFAASIMTMKNKRKSKDKL